MSSQFRGAVTAIVVVSTVLCSCSFVNDDKMATKLAAEFEVRDRQPRSMRTHRAKNKLGKKRIASAASKKNAQLLAAS